MATPWWAKVPADYYKKPSNLSAAVDKRARHYAAVIADTNLRDSPEVAAAFLNGNVPYSVAQRAARQYDVIKNQAATNMLTNAGMPNQVTAQQKASAPPVKPPDPGNYWSLDPANLWDAFVLGNNKIMDAWNTGPGAVPGIPTADGLLNGLRSVPKAVMTIPNMAYSVVQSPVAQTLANTPEYKPGGQAAVKGAVSDAAGGGLLGDLLGGFGSSLLPIGVGLATNVPGVGGAAVSDPQRADMQRNGYDPNSWASRFGWYYDSMEAGQRAVSDYDVRQLKQEYDPEKVDAVREIITSNYLNDGKPEALSPSTQAFIAGLETDQADPRDGELFDRMNHAAGLRPGGVLSYALGQDVGSQASQLTAALGDLAFYWFADPYAAVAKGVMASKAVGRLNRMVPAGNLAAAESALVAVKEPGVLHSPPLTQVGRDMDELLDAVDQVHSYVQLAYKNKGTEIQARAINDANKVWERWSIRHPDQVDQWGAVAQWRAGRLQFIKPKPDAEMEKAVAEFLSSNGKKPMNPWWISATEKPTGPGFALDRTSKESLQQSLNEARADLTSRMSEWIFMNAWKNTQPIIKGQILMPGEVAFNARVRARVAPIRNRLMGADGRVLDYLNDMKAQAAANNVHFDGSLDKLGNLFVGKNSGEWIKSQYTQKWSATIEKIAANFGMSYSDAKVAFASPESLKFMQRAGLGHMPRRMAQFMAIDYARSGPAERRMIAEQWQEMLSEAAHFNSTPLAVEVKNVLTKGAYPKIGQKSPFSVDPGEVYTANRADNEIRVGDQKVAAGIWDYQMAEHMTLPNRRMIRAMQQRTGLLSAVTGLFNKRILNGPTAVWKVGKVGNPANMARQAAEAYGMLLADQGFGAFMGALNSRRTVANATVEQRLEANELSKAANKMYAATQGKPQLLREINEIERSGDVVAYRRKLTDIARSAGFAPEEVGALATLAEGVHVSDLMRLTPWGKTAVAMAGVLSPLRRIRLVAAEQLGRAVPGLKAPKDVQVEAAWHQWSDQDYINGMTRFALDEFGHAADDAIFLAGGNVGQELAGAAKLGMPGRPAVLPNARDWLGTAGDSGAINWFKELDSRQTDKVGNEVMRAVAIEARHGGPATIADILNASRTTEKIPAHLDNAHDIARWLIAESENGARLRALNDHLAYDEFGGRIREGMPGIKAWDDSLDRLVEVQVRDAALTLGARQNSAGHYTFDPAYHPMLDKLGYARQVNLKDLSAIPNDLRPKEMSASLYIPGLGNMSKANIVDYASKLYSFTVARPLQRLAINPIYLANKNIAYREMGPLAAEFINRGYTPKQTQAILEQTANNYAVKTTFRYTDNVAERSFFSEITENFLMFNRASEDFLRRFSRVASANPALLSKSYLLMEAANHSGLIYPQTETNDDGTEETHLVFTFPGSALMAKAIAEGGRALGWGDSDLVAQALYSSMSSQVRYVNPSLSNPFGFSTSPMIGMPLRFMRTLFPETDSEITNTLARMEGGGERFFAEQEWWQSLMPTPLARLMPAITQDERDGQLASSVRNAIVYYGAAGLLPGEDATDDEIEEAHQSIKAMATNQLVWRALVGTFSPWAPAFNAPQGTGLPESNVLDQARGINNVRGEWFDVLREAAEKVGGEAAMGAASTEWFRRHPDGGSILHPGAFLTGTTDNPGNASEAPNVASGPAITEWMIANKGWLKENQSVAYYLIPNYLEAQYTAQGMRDQLRNQVRVHRDGLDFYKEMRYQVAMKTYWDKVNQKSAAIASGANKKQVNAAFKQWENDWRTAHPATAAEKARREDPAYVKGTLAPALGRLVNSGSAPQGVDLGPARQMWDLYSAYQTQYNKTPTGARGKDQRYSLNEQYRATGDRLFLGTSAHDLWKAMDIYEDGS